VALLSHAEVGTLTMRAWLPWLIFSRASPRLLRGKRRKKEENAEGKGTKSPFPDTIYFLQRLCLTQHQPVLTQEKLCIQPATLSETL